MTQDDTVSPPVGPLSEGFPGERMLVLPRPQVRAALAHQPLQQLLVTDCGYFPHASGHGRARRTPIDQAVILICVRGAGWVRTADGHFGVGPGQVAVIPPRTPHAYGADPDAPWTLWWVHIAGQSVPALCAATKSSTKAPIRVPGDPSGTALRAAEIVSTMVCLFPPVRGRESGSSRLGV